METCAFQKYILDIRICKQTVCDILGDKLDKLVKVIMFLGNKDFV